MEISITDIKLIKKNPKNPRTIKDEKFKKLVKSIQDFPQMLSIRPIVVNDDMIVLGGNMRLAACIEAGLKEVPYIKASELTEEQQNEFVIKDNSSFGEWDWLALNEEWDENDLESWGIEIPNFGPVTENYSRKIESPVYQPKEEKPSLKTLVNKTKTNELISKIKQSNISEEEKEFLILSAQRHLVFNYSKIADYYSNASKEMQELMEDSALVIIDFHKAIELGFVKLSKKIMEQYSKDYNDEQ
jgi:hypothetical protein